MTGKVQINETGDNVTILLDGDTGAATVGGEGEHGGVVLRDDANNQRLLLTANDGDIRVQNSSGDPLLHWHSGYAALYVGGQGDGGDVVIRDEAANERIHLSGGNGDIVVNNGSGDPLLHWHSGYAALYVGGTGDGGDVVILDEAANERIHLSAVDGDLRVKNPSGDELFHFYSDNAALYVGGQGKAGDVIVRDAAARERIHLWPNNLQMSNSSGDPIFLMRAALGNLYVGGKESGGDVVVRDAAARERIRLSGNEGDIRVDNPAGDDVLHFQAIYANLYLGGKGVEGDLVVRDEEARERIHLTGTEGDIRVQDAEGNTLFHFESQHARLFVGGHDNEGDVVVINADGNETIRLNGESGDIILSNADCAEEFDIRNPSLARPGTVMVIDDEEYLTPATKAYDRRVVGVVSGAGGYRPGIVLDRRKDNVRRPAVALVGKVFCKVDASYGPIHVGDLLVSSPTPGHAMAARDCTRWPGAVLGKALRAWTDGAGMIPCLVSLQ